MTEREKEIIDIIKKYPIATTKDIKKLYFKIKLKIAQLENTTKLEIEKVKAEIIKSENRIIKFILNLSIIQTIVIIGTILGIIFWIFQFLRK
mgnify:CR=1 FL=1